MAKDKALTIYTSQSEHKPYSIVGSRILYIGAESGFEGENHLQFLNKRYSKDWCLERELLCAKI